ncbi:MAG TPA: glycosyltransferase [Candidatus Eremiobacteraceae bacterium]|nr:glycosyltransferase [Candidatus Eremiobacteraceae bacterium]
MPPSIAIGVMAHNEEANIGRLLESLLAQTAGERIAQIIVVASGCTDRTCAIVEAMSARDARIKLAAQAERGGKVSAINLFLTMATEPLLLVSGADMILEPQTVFEIVAPFDDPDIGMVGAHPIPSNDPTTFLGFASHLLWRLHHEVSLIQPKMGELIAFRNIFRGLDPDMLADEVQIEHGVRSVGYRVAYAPNAVIRNRGPETLREFIAQRTRWLAFNMQIEREQRIPVSTLRTGTLWRALRSYLRADKPRLDWVAATAFLELSCRVRARFAAPALRSSRHRLWSQATTTKDVARQASTV